MWLQRLGIQLLVQGIAGSQPGPSPIQTAHTVPWRGPKLLEVRARTSLRRALADSCKSASIDRRSWVVSTVGFLSHDTLQSQPRRRSAPFTIQKTGLLTRPAASLPSRTALGDLLRSWRTLQIWWKASERRPEERQRAEAEAVDRADSPRASSGPLAWG